MKNQKLIKLNKEIKECRLCPGLNDPKVSPSAPGYGRPFSPLMIVGQCLHAYNPETDPQIPFVGPVAAKDSGRILFKALELAGLEPLNKDHMFITNVLHCHCPNHRTPTDQEIMNCNEFLQAEIDIIQPKYFLLLGAIARQWFSFGKSPSSFNSFVHVDGSFILAAHPSYLTRQGSQKLIRRYINQLSAALMEVIK